MRRSPALILIACTGLLMSACMDTPSKLDATPGEEPSPVTGSSPQATLDRVKVSTDLAAIRTAIQMYRQDHENANAPDLDSLGVSGLHYPDAYTYDPTTGTVTCDSLSNL